MSTNILEYSYENETNHLDDGEALEKYKREKVLHPEALIVIEDLNCGHWDVEVYQTEEEKQEYLQKKTRSILDKFLAMLKIK